MLRVLWYPLVVLAVILFLAWVGQRRMIYFPFGDVPSAAEVGLPRAEAIAFKTDDGLTLNGWFVPAFARSDPSPGYGAAAPVDARAESNAGYGAVIVFNGNAGNRSMRADLAARFAEAGFASLLFDYRGYGGNAGSPSEEGLARDARAARRYLESRAGVDSDRIVYFGESLGTGVAVRLAVERRPRALILRSPFTSLLDTARHHYPYLPVGWLLRDRFMSIDLIPRVACPVLVIAAAHDSIVPTDQSRRLFGAASEPKRLLIVENTDHNDSALSGGPQMIAAITDFLRRLD